MCGVVDAIDSVLNLDVPPEEQFVINTLNLAENGKTSNFASLEKTLGFDARASGLAEGRFENIENIEYGQGINLLIGTGAGKATFLEPRIGANQFSVGAGAVESFIDRLFNTRSEGAEKTSFFSQGIHTIFGLSGSDTYTFEGGWGLALVAEYPDLLINDVNIQDFVPEFYDTLDFSKIQPDTRFDVYQVSGDTEDLWNAVFETDSSNDFRVGIGSNIVLASTGGLLPDDFDFSKAYGDLFSALDDLDLGNLA